MGSETSYQQNHPVLNWRCRLTQVELYNGPKTVVVVVCQAVSSHILLELTALTSHSDFCSAGFTGCAKKVRPQTRGHDSVNLNQFTQIFHWKFRGKFAVNWLLKIPPLLAYVATLPCEIFVRLANTL